MPSALQGKGLGHRIHRRYFAEDLVRLRPASERRRQAASQRQGRIDANPHQIDAVMFALERIPRGGCILADEVGLGKTIEAGLIISQLLAEGASRILVIVPRPLLGQWQHELYTLFGIEAIETTATSGDPSSSGVFLIGREAAGSASGVARLLATPPFDLCVIDEAHEVFAGIDKRFDKHGLYLDTSPYAQTAHNVRQVIGSSPVLLLTATPIQNTLAELWGLIQYIARRASELRIRGEGLEAAERERVELLAKGSRRSTRDLQVSRSAAADRDRAADAMARERAR
jgi:SNF2 family DNA or RNA helicase